MNEDTQVDNYGAAQTERDPDLKSYVGTKILLAKPMSNSEWVKGRNQESTGQEGYLVIYDNGYQAWSPKDVFDTHYRLLTNEEKLVMRY